MRALEALYVVMTFTCKNRKKLINGLGKMLIRKARGLVVTVFCKRMTSWKVSSILSLYIYIVSGKISEMKILCFINSTLYESF